MTAAHTEAKELAQARYPGRPEGDQPLTRMRRSSFIAGYLTRDAERISEAEREQDADSSRNLVNIIRRGGGGRHIRLLKQVTDERNRARQSRNDLRRRVRALEARITAAQHIAVSGWTVDDEHLGYLKMAPVEEILDALNPAPTPDRQETP